MTAELAERLAQLPELHKSPGRRRREQTALQPCVIVGCDQLGTRYLRGHLCSSHAPAQPSRAPSPVPSPSDRLEPRSYGTATDDPLGRTELVASSRLPRHDR